MVSFNAFGVATNRALKGVLIISMFVLLLLAMSALAFANDRESPQGSIPDGPPGGAAGSPKERIWHVDVNSGCNYSDYDVDLVIGEDPAQIENTLLRLSAWDVDYNDPHDCKGGIEVDYVYLNGKKLGQFQGANNSWSINTFSISPGDLIKGTNKIMVNTDATNTGCWCVGIGYVEVAGTVGFDITEFTPGSNSKNILWDKPNITVKFSSELDTGTMNRDTIKLDYRDRSGNWVDVDYRLAHASYKEVHVILAADLKDGIRYRMRVIGGENGIKGKGGATLDGTTEWTFWTMVNLDGQTNLRHPPNTTKDKLQITWFNTLRNKNLVKHKRVANRIYVLWDENYDVFHEDQVERFDANVTLGWCTGQQTMNLSIRRPDMYHKVERESASNTANFYHLHFDDNETYKLTVEPSPQQTERRVFEKEVVATIDVSNRTLQTKVYACDMAGWFNGAIAADLAAAKSMFEEGARYTTEVFPISRFDYTYTGVGNTIEEIPSGHGGFGMTYKGFEYSPWLDNAINHNTVQGNNATCENVRKVEITEGGVTKTLDEKDVVINYMTNLLGDSKFIVGLVPGDAMPTTLGSNTSCITGLSNNSKHVILLLGGTFNESTVAHEIGHEYGLAKTTGAGCTDRHNNDGSGIEGFRVNYGNNKSFTEGNSEFREQNIADCNGIQYPTSVVPVMYQSKQPTTFRWMREDDYNHLFTSIPNSVAVASAAAAASGDWLVVQGYVDDSGAIDIVSPLYRITQRNIAPPSGTGYTASLLDASGAVIGGASGTYSFGPDQLFVTLDDGRTITTASKMFIFTIPYDDTAQSLSLTGPTSTKTIDRASYGSAPSGVGFTYPTDGATLTGKVTLKWTGTDDGGRLYYRLEHSPNGTDWNPLAHALAATTYSIDTTKFASGANHKLALIAYDGFNSVRKEISIHVNNTVNIAQTVPGNTEQNVSEGTFVLVDFVTPMDASTINSDTFKVRLGSVPVAGRVTYNSTLNRAIFVPTDNLLSKRIYTGIISGGPTGVKDQQGNIRTSSYIWTFTTGQTKVIPVAVTSTPEKGSTNVPISTLITATFNTDILSSTVNTSSFTVADASGASVAGSVTYNASTKRAIFTPSANLSPNTTYTATLTTAITDTNTPANSIASDYSWGFTTGTTKNSGVVINKVEYDLGKDLNGDGLYDTLVVRVQAEVTNPGTFNLNAQLKDQSGLDIQWNYKTIEASSKGVYSIDLEFNGSTIAAHGVDGPYVVANLLIYHASNPGVYNLMRGSYQTYPYKASSFYSAIRLSPIPNISVAQDSTNTDVVNLESYAWHMSLPVTSLTYTKLLDTEPKAGVSINAKHMLDIKPTTGFTGSTDVTVELKDSSGNRALYIVRINVSPAYKFDKPGLYMISLSNQPTDNNLSSVLKSIDGKYDSIWGYANNQWYVYKQGSSLNNLDKIEAGKGYYISMKEAANLTTVGAAIASKNISLAKGWNLVGFNSMEAKPMADALDSITGRYLAVFAYINGKWQLYDPSNLAASDLTTMTPGYGYWIYAVMDTNWSLQ
ncbi:MAG: Ig-like domain-containing protein [Nitrospirae bacterium]|uniref:Ig-like domain-containing protein n=1 Tax=Candidatus Magnetobacterium casense TaxID=1455061 RepID=UPI00058BECE1|nr:Ig-like domain-containing protein [Candidatus Magnetobacterium casensis]MBF0337449.1 Ig-like domain-containing protein [Nitrospirota bacterium]